MAYKIKKHKSHIKGKRAKHRPFGKFSKFLKKEEIAWLKQREKDDRIESSKRR